MVGEACLPSNAYYPRTPDYTLCSGVHVCWSEHADSSFVYGFMSLDYGFATMTATTLIVFTSNTNNIPELLIVNKFKILKYSRFLVSRPRLSRITAYIEVTFWSLF